MLLAMLLMIGVCLARPATLTQADLPEEKPDGLTQPTAHTRTPFCLAANDEGPFFSLQDLRARPRPTTEHLLFPAINPPLTTQYPSVLDTIPIAARSYTDETIDYLARHEIRSGDRQKSAVALTFDCENGTRGARQILQTLRQENVKATFFITGRYVYMYPDLIREIAADGHEFGNHSFFHPLFYTITPITATQEITYTEAALDRAIGAHVPMRYFRFPYGGSSNELRRFVATLGYQEAFWTLDPKGWLPDRTPEYVVEYFRNTAFKGAIAILHCSTENDVNALPGIIAALRSKGLEPVTLTDVLSDVQRNVAGYKMPGEAPGN